MSTDQEAFWAGEFGDGYTERHKNTDLLASKEALLATALQQAERLHSALELGANVGLNLQALRSLFPDAELAGVEINKTAFLELAQVDNVDAHHSSLLDFAPRKQWDLVLTAGTLVAIPPESLPVAYEVIERCSSRYVLFAEYYSPQPTSVDYRGYTDRLFKRDFAGEFMDAYEQFALRDYGFVYHRDPYFPLDDVNWFLMERASR